MELFEIIFFLKNLCGFFVLIGFLEHTAVQIVYFYVQLLFSQTKTQYIVAAAGPRSIRIDILLL